MTSATNRLELIGQALYGPTWQTPMSEALGVSDRTIRRWVSGDFAIPDGVWADLAKLCRKRGAALLKLAETL